MQNPKAPTGRKALSGRRLTLLASVAAIGITVLAAGPGGYRALDTLTLGTAAHAAEVAQPAGFADLVAKVKPAVISVRVKMDRRPATMANEQSDDEQFAAPPGSPMEKFFQQFGITGMPTAMPGQRHQMITGEGSGFFISADGYAVTNYHVVDHAKTVQVTTDDGTIYTAKVIGTDPKTDLALIKVDADKDFPVREVRRHDAAHRRLGGRGRQSVRPRRHRDRRHRLGARPRHRRRPL